MVSPVLETWFPPCSTPYPLRVRLYLVRHAEAAPGEPDELRALTPEGRRAARALGEQLAADGVRPDAILSSPLLRARETAAELERATGVAIAADERLGFGATVEGVLAAAEGLGETVVVVAHQPDCGKIAAALGDGTEPPFPPGGMVVLQID
jgi:phosphohistidine phosphatase